MCLLIDADSLSQLATSAKALNESISGGLFVRDEEVRLSLGYFRVAGDLPGTGQRAADHTSTFE